MHKGFCIVAAAWLMIYPTTGKAADMPAQPYQVAVNTGSWTIGPNNNSTVSFSGPLWAIPDGKILVIEHISARARVNRGEAVNVSVTCQGSGTVNVGGLAEHQLILQSAGIFDNLDRLVGSSPFRCYSSNKMSVTFVRNSSSLIPGIVSAEFAVTGFLVDPPK
jgi:hypothetical protein